MLENLKGVLIIVLGILIVGLLGFWAFNTIEPGDIHASREKQVELAGKNQELELEVEDLKERIAELEATIAENTPVEPEPVVPTTPVSQTYKHQTLINELEKLITDKINMKEGSRGSRVGTVQKFLNLYNGTNKRVDNDYGKTTKTAIINFQKKVGLPADGEAGASTFTKMIEWLKKQG